VSADFYGSREESWKEPIDRNFAGLLNDFGSQELAMLVAPRHLTVFLNAGPELVLEGNGGGPAVLSGIDAERAANDLAQANQRAGKLLKSAALTLRDGESSNDLSRVLLHMRFDLIDKDPGALPDLSAMTVVTKTSLEQANTRETRLLKQIDRHNQALLRESPFVRKEFMSKLDMTSVEAYEKVC
jgi:hypothetical protein